MEAAHKTHDAAVPSEPRSNSHMSLSSKQELHIENRTFMARDVKPSLFAELQLLLLTFCTGIQDATTFPDYHCFASNQTGNTVFLCLALILPHLNGDMFIVSNIGAALGLFVGAGLLTGQLSHVIGPRRRWWLVLCNLIQSLLVFAAAGVQHWYGVSVQGPGAVAVVALLAAAAGSQVVQSRSLAMTEISTAMATAAWVDLVIDGRLFEVKNRSRTRRVCFLLALAAGAFVGAVIYRHAGSAMAIFVSGIGKLVVAILYLVVPTEKSCKHDPEA
ncbi:hypothetical protein B0I35DRAFT_417950 [Stachybotrys elegans]|uniref:DUF1275 domain protein n=1 Tax=Stachybotrys elegans TaxID=80388 RepID=A0A8K0T786_9HYPO|nr:hypothetical protein B0I35DRAFT_417950 [Stachybotrys elegans]